MPELGRFNPDIINFVSNDLFRTVNVRSEREQATADFAATFGVQTLGVGAHSAVFGLEDPKKVIAINYNPHTKKEPASAKRLYYTHRIFNRLFPHSFPHIYSSFGSLDAEGISGTIRERIIKGSNTEVKRLAEVVKICHRWGLHLEFDGYEGNFITDKEGNEYYVDELILPPGYERPGNFAAFMEHEGYGEDDKRVVQSSIRRLQELEPTTIVSPYQEELGKRILEKALQEIGTSSKIQVLALNYLKFSS